MANAEMLADLRGQVLDLEMAGDDASLALARDLQKVIDKHSPNAATIEALRDQIDDLARRGDHASLALAADLREIVAAHTGESDDRDEDLEDEDDDCDGYDEDDYFDDEFDGDEDDEEYPPQKPQLVIRYWKADGSGPLSHNELQAVIADAQGALNAQGIGRLEVVSTMRSQENPNESVVTYDVAEPGETSLSMLGGGHGGGYVNGVGTVQSRQTIVYVDVDEDTAADTDDGPELQPRLVVTYTARNGRELTEAEAHLVVADAQGALEAQLRTAVRVVDIRRSAENPSEAVVYYEVVEAGERPLTSMVGGLGSGYVNGIGAIDARASIEYVAPEAAAV